MFRPCATPFRRVAFVSAATLLPATVAILMLTALLTSAWPSLQPVPVVSVIQVAATARSENQPRREQVQAPGWLEADPFFVACAALADGVIASVDVLEGDRVEEGQVVARLVSEDAELQRDRVAAARDAAQAELARRKAEQKAAQLDWDHPIERERAVATAAAALDEAHAALAQLPAEIRAGEALLVQFEEEREKAKRSLAFDAATDLEVTITSQRALAQKAQVEVLKGREPILQARVARLRAEHIAAQRNLELRIEEARRLAEAQAGTQTAAAALAQAETALAEAELELQRMVIRAPISGFVQRRLRVPGDKLMRMTNDLHSLHVVHLYDPKSIQVRVDVPLADARHVSVGQRCEVTVEVLPKTPFVGEVSRITHEADLQKNTLQVKVRVLDPSPLLRPEMLTRVRFLSADADPQPQPGSSSGLHVTPDVIDGAGETTRVLAVRQRRGKRGVLVAVPVRVLHRNETAVAIDGDLFPGDLLVRQPAERRSGQRVEVQPG